MAAFERILVTGGAGFVGGHLCAALAVEIGVQGSAA
jgi:GDP-4-dehydro-6-deoxy-D-mannose reductase